MSEHPPAQTSTPSTQAMSGPPGYEIQSSPSGHLPSHSIPPSINATVSALSDMSMDNSGTMLSPSSGGGRRGAPEPNKRVLYVGNLGSNVTEEYLRSVFDINSNNDVANVKVIPDKNQFHTKGLNYGFVEYHDPACAEHALNLLNNKTIHDIQIRVNWAYLSKNHGSKEDTSNHFHVFVGDISNEVTDDLLYSTFSNCGNVSEARVMWDMKTGRTRGFGFVAYRTRQEAENAINNMDGVWLGARAVRCNWANQRGQPAFPSQHIPGNMGMQGSHQQQQQQQGRFVHHSFPSAGMSSYSEILNQSPPFQCTVYVGNLTPYTTVDDLVPLFSNFGPIVETRLQADRGYAFVRMETHEQAAHAICQLCGYLVNSRPIKCSWGKDRPPALDASHGTAGNSGAYQYSPQPASSPGYGFPASPHNYQNPQQFPGSSTGQPGSNVNIPYVGPAPYAVPPQGPQGAYQQQPGPGQYGRAPQYQNQNPNQNQPPEGQWGGGQQHQQQNPYQGPGNYGGF